MNRAAATGRANYYDVRFQAGNAGSFAFATATRARAIWTPGPAGVDDFFTVTGLDAGTE